LTLTITIDPTWLKLPAELGRLLSHLDALQHPAPWSPPPAREPGCDDDSVAGDDLGELLDGIDIDSPAPPPAPATPPKPAPALWNGPPTTGQQLYRLACNAKVLPRVNAIGKVRGWHRLVTHWDADQVAVAYRELTRAEASAVPATNGKPR
jgi:hypothetical protein